MTVLVAKLFFVCSSLKLNYKMEGLMFISPKGLLFVLLFLPTCISKGIRKKKEKKNFFLETATSVPKFCHCVV